MPTYKEKAETAERELTTFKKKVVEEVMGYDGRYLDAADLLGDLGLEIPSKSIEFALTWNITLTLQLPGTHQDRTAHPGEPEGWMRLAEDWVDRGEVREAIDSHTDNELFDSDLTETNCSVGDVTFAGATPELLRGKWYLNVSITSDVGGTTELDTSERPEDLQDFLASSVTDEDIDLDKAVSEAIEDHEVDAGVTIGSANWE